MTLAAVQTATMLAVSFAGCLPVAAWLLPRLGEGDMALVTPTTGRLPEPMIDVLTASPIGWGYGRRGTRRPRRRRVGTVLLHIFSTNPCNHFHMRTVTLCMRHRTQDSPSPARSHSHRAPARSPVPRKRTPEPHRPPRLHAGNPAARPVRPSARVHHLADPHAPHPHHRASPSDTSPGTACPPTDWRHTPPTPSLIAP